MSNNCLVKTLKGLVSNTERYKINELRMFLPAGNKLTVNAGSTIIANRSFTITPLEGSFTCNNVPYNVGGSPLQVTGTGRQDITVSSTADAVVSISDKQAFTMIDCTGDRVSSVSGKHRAILNTDLGYMMNLIKFDTYMAFNAEHVGKFPLLTTLGRANYYERFSPYVWRNFINHDNFPVLETLVASSNDVTDQVNISAFSSLITLTFARFTVDYGFVGALEDLAQGMINAGRTSGNLGVLPNPAITYNGEACDNSKSYTISFSGSSYTISVSA